MIEQYDNLPQFDNSVFIQEHITKEGKSQKLAYYERGNLMTRSSLGQQYEVRKYSGVSLDYLGEVLCLKIIKKQQNFHLLQNIYENQIMISKLINNQQSKRFTKFVTNWENKKYFFIIFEKSKIGNLHELANLTFINNFLFTEGQILYFAREMLKGIQMLHDIKIMHRDFKLHNIQINDKFELKISQFGSSKATFSEEKPQDTRVCGTPYYMAPQIMQIALLKSKEKNKMKSSKKQGSYSSQVDIWSLGISLYYLIYKKYPFGTKDQLQYYQKIVHQDIPFQQIKNYQHVIKLVKQILVKQPSKRLKAKQILDLQIFTKINAQSIKQVLLQKFKAFFDLKINVKKQWTRQINRIKLQIDQDILLKINKKRKVRIIKVHYDQKYGYFFLLSNFNFCAYFNDGRSQKIDKKLIDGNQKQNKYTKIMLFMFKKYFYNSFSRKQNEQIEQETKFQPNCKIFKLLVFKNVLFIRLSNQVLQLFFGSQENNIFSYEKYILINSNDDKKEQVLFINKNNEHSYQNYEKGLASQHFQYFNYTKNALQLMLDNSIFPSEKLINEELTTKIK